MTSKKLEGAMVMIARFNEWTVDGMMKSERLGRRTKMEAEGWMRKRKRGRGR